MPAHLLMHIDAYCWHLPVDGEAAAGKPLGHREGGGFEAAGLKMTWFLMWQVHGQKTRKITRKTTFLPRKSEVVFTSVVFCWG